MGNSSTKFNKNQHLNNFKPKKIDLKTLQQLSEFFKVFGDATRISIINLLSQRELCVYDIANLLGIHQSVVSHQLKILKQNRLVKYRREGKSIFYSLDDNHVENIFNTGLNHLKEVK